MKNIFTTALFLLFLIPSFAQKDAPKDIDRMNQAYKKLTWCYYGKRDDVPLEIEEMNKLLNEGKKEIASLKGKYEPTYPIFFALCEHLRFSMEADAVNACRHLRNALEDFRKLNKKPAIKADALRRSYLNYFGIDSFLLKQTYQSQYCQDLNITLDTPCPMRNGEVAPPPVVKPEPVINKAPVQNTSKQVPVEQKKVKPKETPIADVPKIAVHTDDGVVLKVENGHTYFKTSDDVYEDPNPIDLLRKVLSRGLITDAIEITEMVPGDGRLIPGQKGVPYEVKLKNARTKEVIYFKGGEYTIVDEGDNMKDPFFPAYQNAYVDFTRLVLWIMDDYGNSAYQIFVQGSADIVTFTPKLFLDAYDVYEFFHEFEVLKVDKKAQTVSTTLFKVGDTYDNNDLPNLRAAFIRFMLLDNDRLRGRNDKVTAVNGTVKPYRDLSKRNCSVILYIDWDRARNVR